MKEFSVIGYYESTGQTFCENITAETGYAAIGKVAAKQKADGTEWDSVFVCVIPLSVDIEWPGDGVVCAQTVLDQPDVF